MRALLALIASLLLAFPAFAQEVEFSVSTDASGVRSLTHEIVIPAGVDEVWTAVSTLDGWRTWATPVARAVGDGPRFETSYNPDAVQGGPETIEHEWLSSEAPRRVVYRTTRTPQGFPHAEAYLATTSAFELTPVDAANTRVRLTVNNYAAGAEGDALIAFFIEGNRYSLRMLHKRFVDGPVDWPATLGR